LYLFGERSFEMWEVNYVLPSFTMKTNLLDHPIPVSNPGFVALSPNTTTIELKLENIREYDPSCFELQECKGKDSLLVEKHDFLSSTFKITPKDGFSFSNTSLCGYGGKIKYLNFVVLPLEFHFPDLQVDKHSILLRPKEPIHFHFDETEEVLYRFPSESASTSLEVGTLGENRFTLNCSLPVEVPQLIEFKTSMKKSVLSVKCKRDEIQQIEWLDESEHTWKPCQAVSKPTHSMITLRPVRKSRKMKFTIPQNDKWLIRSSGAESFNNSFVIRRGRNEFRLAGSDEPSCVVIGKSSIMFPCWIPDPDLNQTNQAKVYCEDGSPGFGQISPWNLRTEILTSQSNTLAKTRWLIVLLFIVGLL